MTRGAPSSNSFASHWIYDVFINFRGEDTRHGFTGNLYHALCQRGIRVFIDDEELQRGEHISPALLKAIQGSRIAILVFSQRYASSTFCLIELVQILEHLHGQGRLVFPVFYDVDPSDVRHQRGNYEQALAKHAERSKDNKEEVQKWRLALHQAANLSGWHFKHGDEYEYEFIRKIVKEVSSKIDHQFLHVANHPVGLEARVLGVNSLIGDGFNDRVNMIGIYGIGGSGKSTLARAMYNFFADQFEDACFLADIREKSLKFGLVQVQETLLSKVGKEKDIEFGDVNQGIPILKRRLREKKVLLILDDVDKIEQLIALAGASDWFGLGSSIIITTRDEHLLNIHGVDKKYEVQKLNHVEALDLLSWNAFKSNRVDPNYMDILNCVACYAQGLPLALEVIGSNLFGKSLNEWKSALDRYKRIPNKDVQQILKISYDCLEEDARKIFLDIASFHRGHSLKYVMDMVQHAWDFHPAHGIEALVDKSLIKIIDGIVTMHGLIQDMGMNIVREESPENPGKRSRLWSCEDISHVLEENTGTGETKVMIQTSSFEPIVVNWDGKAFKKMKNLKILVFKNAVFSKGPTCLPNSLRVLTWPRYPSVSLPDDFLPRKLTILDLQGGLLQSLPPFKKLENLSVLNLSFCKFIIQIPEVSGFPNLTELWLDYCENLVAIHDSVGNLEKLETLSAIYCAKLKKFPCAIKSRYLKHLGLTGCSSLKNFPEILEKMEHISELDLSHTNLELPFSIKNLIGLKKLRMDGCRRIQVPNSIVMLPKLQLISTQACGELQLSTQDKGQVEVNSMDYSLLLSTSNISDEFLPICVTFFANVQLLQLSYNNFTILPACIKECYHLLYLELHDCKHLKEIRGIPPNIEELWAINCTSLSSESTSILLSQELHESRGKLFCVPGSRIPDWLDHYSRGPSISFWFRNKFPAMTVCLVMTREEKVHTIFPFLSAKVIINRKNIFKGSVWNVSFSLSANHIFVYDLKRTKSKENEMNQVFLESEWNHVELDFAIHGNYPEESGIHVIKQESSMEDILFTDPYQKRKLDDPLTASDLNYHNHRLREKQHGFVDMQALDDDFNWDSSSLVSTSSIAIDKGNNSVSERLSLQATLDEGNRALLSDLPGSNSDTTSLQGLLKQQYLTSINLQKISESSENENVKKVQGKDIMVYNPLEELEEVEYIDIVVSRKRIPYWFNHCSKGGSVAFWVRRKFPGIAVFFLLGGEIETDTSFTWEFCLLINDVQVFRDERQWPMDHVWLFDLRLQFTAKEWHNFNEHLQRGWNHVEISCTMKKNQTQNGTVKCCGIRLYKERMNIDDVSFISPDLHGSDMAYDNMDNDSDIYDEESRKDDDDYDFVDKEEESLTSTNSEISEGCEVVIEDKGKGRANSDNPEEEQSCDAWDLMILECSIGETSDEGAEASKIFLGSTAEAEQEPMFHKRGKLKENVNLVLGSTSTASTSTNKGGQQNNGPSNIKISEKDASIKRKAEATVHFKQNQAEESHTQLPESRVNQQSAAKEIEDDLISVEVFIAEDNMDAFYASLETETTALSDTQINPVFVNTQPSEETQEALQIVRDFVSKKFSLLQQLKESKSIKYILEYLLSLSPDDGISMKTKSVILQLSRSFTRWSLDYNDASHKLESAGADLSKVDELKEGLEANVREFREVEKLENEMSSKLVDLGGEKRKLEEHLNAINAQIADTTSAKDTAAQRKRMFFDHGRRLKARWDDLSNRLPRLRAEEEGAKITQVNIEDEWSKLGEQFIASSSFEDWN